MKDNSLRALRVVTLVGALLFCSGGAVAVDAFYEGCGSFGTTPLE